MQRNNANSSGATIQQTQTARDLIRTARRRELRRVNQKVYLKRKKQRETETERKVTLLRKQNNALQLYNVLLRNGKVAELTHSLQTRLLILEIYADLFEYGVSKSQQSLYAKQKAFLQFTFHPDAFIQSERLEHGFKGFLHQWELYTDFL